MITGLRGGRDGFTPPHRLAEGVVAEALNVDYYGGTGMGRKRNGASADTVTFSSGGPFTGTVSFLGRHVPGTDETAAELWAIDDAATPVVGRKAASTQYAAPTLKDNITGNPWDICGASLNGKYYLAYGSAQSRLHCWDGSTVRRAGLAAMGTPSAANTGAGAYAAVLRYYRTRATVQSAGITVRRSEPSTSISFTPSGAGTAARVTQGTVPNEGETHWEVEASTDNVTFFVIATVVIGTTTYDDSAATTSYSSGTLSATTGTYALQKPYKFIAVDQNRLLGFGSYTSTDPQNWVEFSAVVGSLNVGDDERVNTALGYRVSLDENDSGVATGLVGPVNGSYFAFKYRQLWKLTPTGDTTIPFIARAISKVIGSVSHHSIKVAEDGQGRPAIYWMSHKGPYRYGANGLEDLTEQGGNIRDLILGPTKTINLAATKGVAHTVYHSDRKQVWFYYATGSATEADQRLVWDVAANAWTRADGESAKARCSVMFANTQGATMSRDLKPYIGYAGATNKVWKCDDTSATNDGGTAFQAYVTTRVFIPWSVGYYGSFGTGQVLAKAGTGVTLTLTAAQDYGALPASTATALLTPSGSEPFVQVKIENLTGQAMRFAQFTIGDASAVSNAWQVEALVIEWKREDNA